jgi:ribA/ribD-fused uncharacterized protein
MIYPHIHPYSIGWRMGYGEGYKFDFFDWLDTLSAEDKEKYKSMFPPPVLLWKDWYDQVEDTGNAPEPWGYFPENADACVYFWNENGEPKYSREWLMKQNASQMDFAFFWHKGDIEHDPYCCFSQWQYSEFMEEELSTLKNLTCTEQYMMASKAWIFGDGEIKKEILETRDPKQMKSLGRKVRNFDAKIWNETKHSVVLNGNYHKFSQNKDIRDILLGTGDKILVEASPMDTIWGIGLSANNVDAAIPSNWRGSNLLGFAFMEVRDELRQVYKNYDKVDWAQFE